MHRVTSQTIVLAISMMPAITGIVQAQGANCALSSNASVTGVVNAASAQAPISPDSLISIFGAGFGNSGVGNPATANDYVNGKYPMALACVAVEIAGQRVPITFVGGSQVNAQVPASAQAGNASLTVVLNPGQANESRSTAFALSIQSYGPAFFTLDGHSVAGQHDTFEPLADAAAISGARPARPGDWIILYGTGFGLTQPVYQAGELPAGAAPLGNPVTVSIGGTTLSAGDIIYAGLAPGSISGLYQFNVRIPDNASPGDAPVAATIGGVQSPSGVTIPIRQARLIHVPGDFATIQSGVNAAVPGDTVEVAPGTYPENVSITKSGIRLLAQVGQQRALVEGTGLMGAGILIQGTAQAPVSGVEVEGFVVQNFVDGIRLEHATLSLVHLNETRLNVSKVPPWTVVDADGILLLNSTFNQIRGNYSHQNGHDTIILGGGNVGNLVEGNVVAQNGFDTGVTWAGPWQNHGGCGISLLQGLNNNNYIVGNQISNGDWGVLITGGVSTGNVVANNDIHSNNRAGVALGTGGVTFNLIMNNNATANGVGNIAPSLGNDLYSDVTAINNTWVGNQGKPNF